MKYLYSCFSSHFYFLVIFVLLILVLSVYCFWSLYLVFLCSFLCSLRVVLSMYQRYLQCWWVIFLLLFLTFRTWICHFWDVRLYASSWVFFFSDSIVEVLNCLEYLTKVTAQVFITLMRFLQCSLVSSSFLILLRYLFLIFSFISDFLLCLLPMWPSTFNFPFLRTFWFRFDLVILFLLSSVVFCFSLLAWHIFRYQIPSLYPHWLFSQPVFGFPIIFHFWLTVWCSPCTLVEVCVHLWFY